MLLTKIVFFGCKKIDEQQKKEAKKRTDQKELMSKNVKNESVCSLFETAISTFSPVGSLSSNGLRMRVHSTGIERNELRICGYAA